MRVLLLTALAGGCSYPSLREIAPSVNSSLCPESFFVVGDTVAVRFPQKPEWDHETLVREDGKGTFLFLGDLVVAGSTVAELNEKLGSEYRAKENVGTGTVAADLVNPAAREVMVIGEVNTPGAVPFGRGDMTFLEALARAGGPAKGSALLEETLLVRWVPEERRQRVWRFDANLDNWVEGTPLLLQPHDVIFVPNNFIDKVNVWVDKYIRQNLPLPIAIPVGNF